MTTSTISDIGGTGKNELFQWRSKGGKNACALHYALCGLPTYDPFNPIMRSRTGLIQSGRAVGMVYFGRFMSGLLLECF